MGTKKKVAAGDKRHEAPASADQSFDAERSQRIIDGRSIEEADSLAEAIRDLARAAEGCMNEGGTGTIPEEMRTRLAVLSNFASAVGIEMRTSFAPGEWVWQDFSDRILAGYVNRAMAENEGLLR